MSLMRAWLFIPPAYIYVMRVGAVREFTTAVCSYKTPVNGTITTSQSAMMASHGSPPPRQRSSNPLIMHASAFIQGLTIHYWYSRATEAGAAGKWSQYRPETIIRQAELYQHQSSGTSLDAVTGLADNNFRDPLVLNLTETWILYELGRIGEWSQSKKSIYGVIECRSSGVKTLSFRVKWTHFNIIWGTLFNT